MLSHGFLSVLLHHYDAAQHIFSPIPAGRRGLVEGLYLFTFYALPLTALRTAFGSDYLALLGLGFLLNTAI